MRNPLIKVLIVNNRAGLYGSEKSLLEMVRGFRRVTPIVALPEEGPLSELLRRARVEVVIADFRDEESEPRRLARMRDLLGEKEIDVLHLNKTSFGVGLCRKASWEKGIPLVVHVRSEFQVADGDMTFLSSAERIVFVSESARRVVLNGPSVRTNSKISWSATRVVPDGRTLEDYARTTDKRRRVRAELAISGNSKVVALVGFIDPLKGQDLFVDLARKILSVSRDFRFLIIGDVLYERGRRFEAEVKGAIDAAGLGQEITLTGFLDCREVFSAVDFTVSLSQTEGLPGVIIEAMAAENVVVANAVGGIPELIGPDGAGICVEKDDIDAMRHTILRLSARQDLRTAIGLKARTRAERKFSSVLCASRIEEIYLSMLGSDVGAMRE